jgi:hypothetical protein
MVARLGLLLLAGFTWMAAARPLQAAPLPEAQDIAAEDVERGELLPADIAWLDNPNFKWMHLQTEHFVLHHDQKMFAAKVARLGEQFYAAISADLPDLRDRTSPKRSHIFIFRDSQEWQTVMGESPSIDSWASSFVRGNAMFLQETGTAAADKMDTLAHEMTHLVFNRFLPVRLPLWLNEGLAEYYGEFAYRAARGMGQGKHNAFRPLKNQTPLADLLSATAYPVDPVEVNQFYVTCKYLTGFLLLERPREQWDVFFARLLAGDSPTAALLDSYGWADVAALEKAFAQFTR